MAYFGSKGPPFPHWDFS